MSVVAVESLLQPISPDMPCGENLEYREVRDLETLAAGKPERQQGEKFIPAEEPSWGEVKQQAIDLFSKTKDLRVAALLAQALVRTDGLQGLSDGLEVISQLLGSHWAGVHPQPDAADDYTIRLSALTFLSDLQSLLNPIRRAELVSTPAHGRVSLRDIQIAAGKTKAAQDETSPPAAAIEATFRECDVGRLRAVLQAVERSLQHAGEIEALWAANANSRDLEVSRLTGVLQEIRKELQPALASHPDAIAQAAEDIAGAGEEGGAARAGAAPFAGAIRNREDIIRVLDSACDYLTRHEPSSPVPLLLQRAKRLMVKDFLQIIQDLAPDAADQVAKIGGIDSQSSS
ncbi:MAG TPA: type VI secretion system protein TssA [Burkholderiales bacterium]|nr:type VI secretion system protein TssA [Burkholderiales bacterium]